MSTAAHLFKPGQSGNPKGRPKGAKAHPRFEVAEIMKRVDCNPFEILANLAINSRSEKVRCEAASELASYLAPKLKAVEISSDPESPVQVYMNFGNATNNNV